MNALIVSDRTTITQGLSAQLSSLDLTVTICTEANAVLDTWRAESPQLVVIDLAWIGTVGLQLCREIHRQPQGSLTGLAFVVAPGLLDSLGEIVAAGADQILLDTEDPRLVRARLQMLLETVRVRSDRLQELAQRTESEHRLQLVFDHADVGLYQSTPAGEIRLANPALVRMLGFPSVEVFTARPAEESYAPGYPREEFKKQIERNGHVEGLESAWVRHDGSLMYLMENATAIRDEAGTTLCYVGTVEDVTDRKLAEDALHSSEEMLQALFRPAHQCIFVKDHKLRYVRISNAAEEFFGHSAEEMLGQGDADLFGDEAAAAMSDAEQRVLGGDVVERKETLPIAGEPRTFNILRVPLRNASGRIVGLCGVVREDVNKNGAVD